MPLNHVPDPANKDFLGNIGLVWQISAVQLAQLDVVNFARVLLLRYLPPSLQTGILSIVLFAK